MSLRDKMNGTLGGEDLGSLLLQMFGIPADAFSGRASAGGDTSGQGGSEAAGSSAGSTGSSGSAGPSTGGASNPPEQRGPGIMETIAMWSRRALIALAVVALLVLAGCYWWFHPAINLHSTQVWGWILLVCAVLIVALVVMGIRHKSKKGLFHKLIAVPVLVIVCYFVGIVSGFSVIPGNAARYASVLELTDGNFAEDIAEVDYSEIPVIDRDSAVLLGNRAMGSIPEYVSQFEISSIYSQINYQGRPVRVSPLVYADLFKWFINRDEGIPAYVIVDMTTQEAEVVRLEQPILYSESEPLARNIDRYVQLKYPTYIFDEKSFELDEDGTPWWVFPVQTRTVGLFEGTTIARVVLVNACTGETEDYAIADCPEWVDRAYPSDLLVEQYNWYGLYSGGWLNSWLGQVGVVQTTPGTDGNLGYNYIAQNDDVYLYSGVSSVTADNSIVGFILVNQRTGDAQYFSVAGATEESAMTSAEGQVQNLRYSATFPLLLNIDGQPTYFMALKDDAGLVKKYAMVNIEHYQNVAVGDTVAECEAAYVKLLATNGMIDAGEAAVELVATADASGTIATITEAVVDGNSHFYVTLEGDDAIYDFALPTMLPIVTYQVGDEVEFSYAEGDAANTVTAFEDIDATGSVFAAAADEAEDAEADDAEDADEAEVAA
jgi:predicted membrane protein